jgi:hypothetical protein
VKLDTAGRRLHVTRAIYCYAWEGYHAGDNVYLSREIQKWVRDLVGSIDLELCLNREELRGELIGLLFQAVVGCSRLPLQSVEVPLPAFSLGGLGYFDRLHNKSDPQRSTPIQSFHELIDQILHGDLAWLQKAKLLELVLRSTATEDLQAAAELFSSRWGALGYSCDDFIRLCRTLFNEVALSPYTDFVDKLLIFLGFLEGHGWLAPGAHVDFLSYTLRQTVRHLTAYDLVTFHHRGANYPDALLLNAVLRAFLNRIEKQPSLFLTSDSDDALGRRQKQMRRRALRQAWLMRRLVEALPIPDAPTSPGENARVLPPPFERVPQEQIYQPDKRTKRLFEGEPLLFPGESSRMAMQQSINDFRYPEELRELGMAVFLDRPLGIGKAATEPDRTLLFSYKAFSFSLAVQRLEFLSTLGDIPLHDEGLQRYKRALLSDLRAKGIPITPGPTATKPGAVSLQDALRVAEDFLVLRTTRQAATAFLLQFDFTAVGRRIALDFLDPSRRLLIASAISTRSGPEEVLDIYDASLQRRLELQIDWSQGYESRAGQEYPAAGLRVLRAREVSSPGGGAREDLEWDSIVIPPRASGSGW